MNQKAMIRYRVLDECFAQGRDRNRKYYIEDLVEACTRRLQEHYLAPVGVQERQVRNDMEFMKTSAGGGAPIEAVQDGKRKYYRYTRPYSYLSRPISPAELSLFAEAVGQLSSMSGLLTTERLQPLLERLQKDLDLSVEDRCVVSFEGNADYEGNVYLAPLYDFIQQRQPISVHYQTFGGKEEEWVVHPYFLKQYNQRWFLFGRNDAHRKGLVTVPLDRIVAQPQAVRTAYVESETDFTEYFDDVVGVSVPQGRAVERVVLRFSAERFPYVKTKPLHGTMKRVAGAPTTVTVELKPNHEFKALLLSYGASVEVLSPAWLREEMQGEIAKMMGLYPQK